MWTPRRSDTVQPERLERRVVSQVRTLLAAVLALLLVASGVDAQARRGGPPRGGYGGEPGYGGPPGYGAPGGYGRYPGGRPGYPGGYQPPPGYPAAPYGRAPGGPPGAPPRPGAGSLGADWREQQDEARQGVRQGQMAPLGRVIDNLQRRAPGRELDAGIEMWGQRAVYRVRWVTAEGRRVDFIVDASSGAVLSGR